jgi:hypothetical protein
VRLAWLVALPLLAAGCSSPVARQVGVTGPSRAEQLSGGARRLPPGRSVYWLGPASPVYWSFGLPLPSTPWICQEPTVPGKGRVAFCVVTYLRPSPQGAFRPGEYQLVVRLARPGAAAVLVYARVPSVDPALRAYARAHVRRYVPTSAG